jgi:hypothetical protein
MKNKENTILIYIMVLTTFLLVLLYSKSGEFNRDIMSDNNFNIANSSVGLQYSKSMVMAQKDNFKFTFIEFVTEKQSEKKSSNSFEFYYPQLIANLHLK